MTETTEESRTTPQQSGVQNNASLLAAVEDLTKATHNLAQEIKSCFQGGKPQEECTDTDGLVHLRDSNGNEKWYDSHGNVIRFRHSTGYEGWYDYDEHSNRTHYRDSDGYEVWYDGHGSR